MTVFPDEIYAAPQAWAERAYPNLIHYIRHPVGTHFAAWEQPQLLSQDLRDGVPVAALILSSGGSSSWAIDRARMMVVLRAERV